MKNLKNTKKATFLGLFLLFAITVSMFALPNNASAAISTTKIVTYPFVDAIPNPVGVGQKCLINFGLLNYLNADGDGWNVTCTITCPNGTAITLGPLKTWSTGTVGKYFTPTEVGTYKLQCHFPETNYTYMYYTTPMGGTYNASNSEILYLNVTETATPSYPSGSMPSEYWSRPIDSQLREWWSIAGSWTTTPNNLYAPYNDAPETGHVLWTTALGDTDGGLVGGDTGDKSYQNGDAYEGKFASSVIISGVLYYNKYANPLLGASPQQTIVAIDLHTGQKLWEKSLPSLPGTGRILIGQTLYWSCLNSRGAFSYIWVANNSTGNIWYALDAKTGDLKYNMTNVPGGTNYVGPNGEILKYSLVNYGNTTNPEWHLLQWNSSYVVTKDKVGMRESWGSQVQGVSYDATERGYDRNVTLTNGLTGSILYAFPEDRIIVGNVLTSNVTSNVTLSALKLDKANFGTAIFTNKTWTAPDEWKDLTVVGSIGQAGWCAWSNSPYVGVYWTKENRQMYAFSLETGEHLYTTAQQTYADAWSDTVTSYGPDKIIVYGRLYSASVGGIVYCYNASTGASLWNYSATDKYTESYITHNWWIIPLFASDGKIYFGSLEHSALNPMPRGAPFFALDAATGALVWEADGLFRQTRWGGRAIIGDSIIATQDTYNGQIYAIGKGPSQVTVNPITSSITKGSSVVISGTVTDISPGTADSSINMRFPNGVPAVSDACMSEWMAYVYKQTNKPMNATGITVSINAVDSNGNTKHLGDTTTDISGYYSLKVTPELEGKYTVYVTFAGTNSYYSSYAETSVGVDAAAATQTPTTSPPSVVEQYFVPVAGMILVIALIGVVLSIVMLRRKP